MVCVCYMSVYNAETKEEEDEKMLSQPMIFHVTTF